MTNEERNKIIAEALGLCWHVRKYSINSPTFGRCIKCGVIYASHPDFSTWDGFGLIMERGQTKKWWIKLWCCLWDCEASSEDFLNVLMSGESFMRMLSYVDPAVMCAKLSTWLEANPEKWRKG